MARRRQLKWSRWKHGGGDTVEAWWRHGGGGGKKNEVQLWIPDDGMEHWKKRENSSRTKQLEKKRLDWTGLNGELASRWSNGVEQWLEWLE